MTLMKLGATLCGSRCI